MRKILFLFVCLPLGLLAQVCDGNLGDNIFTNGDFGSGAPNILLGNPNIAPGYTYSSAPPPNDGAYTITNSTAAWLGLFPTWLEIQDNSPDPNGYMMVVNASFAPGLFYDQTIEGLCDNTQYSFSADIINMIAPGVSDHIDPNVTFTLDGIVQFETGEIPKTGQWQTYGFTFTTAPGQTTIQLGLRNNAPGGIGNDLALDNISFRACGDAAFILPETVANICEDGDPIELFATVEGGLFNAPNYQWQTSPDGENDWTNIPGATTLSYTHDILAAGIYYYRFRVANGFANLDNEKCAINSNVKAVQVLPTEFFIVDSICQGVDYPVGPSVYTESGNYVDSLLNFLGCDSIVYTDLTVVEPTPLQWELDILPPSCFDQSDGQITILNASPVSPPFEIFLDDVSVGGSTFFSDLSGGQSYELALTDRFSCTYDTLVELSGPDALSLDLGPDLDVNLGQPANVVASTNFPVSVYSWSSSRSEALPCSTAVDCPSLNWFPTQNQVISVEVQDEAGCIITDSLRINIKRFYQVFAPNAFSPNQDGVNDRFTLFGDVPRIEAIVTMEVYNRWGTLVFSGTNLPPGDLAAGWDGEINGTLAPPGVYVYYATVQFLDGWTETLTGDVVLLR